MTALDPYARPNAAPMTRDEESGGGLQLCSQIQWGAMREFLGLCC